MELVLAVTLVLAALIAAAAAWPARRLDPWSRAAVLISIAAFNFALPLMAPKEPMLVRAVTVLVCTVTGTKLLSLGVEAAWWRERSVWRWLFFVLEQFILVPRLHMSAPGRPGALNRALRGLVEIVAGVAILWWAFHADLPFWPDHLVKIAGGYLCFFDGLFVWREGVARLCGMHMLPLSRDPILAVTPADFWRRYNCEAGRFLREDIYRPLQPHVGNAWAVVIVFAANGLLHEYLAYLLVGRVQGYQLEFFAVHGVAVLATWRVRPRGPSKVVWRIGTIAFVLVSLILFFASVQNIFPFYARGGLLP